MIASVLREIKWYHVVGSVLSLGLILAFVFCRTCQECSPKILPGNDNGDII